MLRALLPGLRSAATVSLVDPSGTVGLIDRRGALAVARRRLASRATADRLLESVRDLRPDVVMVVKGRGLDDAAVTAVRDLGVPVAVYYPDNPYWQAGDTPGTLGRLAAADLVITWSTRLADELRPACRDVAVLPFGYDAGWYTAAPPGGDRAGVAFLGTWYRRRERFARALDGLPLEVRGTGWPADGPGVAGGPVYEREAGAILRRAAIGLNILHPANAGGHNMRTREIAASGALVVTDPGADGTPLRHGESCVWFHDPDELRDVVRWYLEHPDEAAVIAARGQALVIHDTYEARGRQLADVIAGLVR